MWRDGAGRGDGGAIRSWRAVGSSGGARLGACCVAAMLCATHSVAFGQPALRCVGSTMVVCVDIGFARSFASVAMVASLAVAMCRLSSNTMVVDW